MEEKTDSILLGRINMDVVDPGASQLILKAIGAIKETLKEEYRDKHVTFVFQSGEFYLDLDMTDEDRSVKGDM